MKNAASFWARAFILESCLIYTREDNEGARNDVLGSGDIRGCGRRDFLQVNNGRNLVKSVCASIVVRHSRGVSRRLRTDGMADMMFATGAVLRDRSSLISLY